MLGGYFPASDKTGKRWGRNTDKNRGCGESLFDQWLIPLGLPLLGGDETRKWGSIGVTRRNNDGWRSAADGRDFERSGDFSPIDLSRTDVGMRLQSHGITVKRQIPS